MDTSGISTTSIGILALGTIDGDILLEQGCTVILRQDALSLPVDWTADCQNRKGMFNNVACPVDLGDGTLQVARDWY